jgi:hypothetical protein
MLQVKRFGGFALDVLVGIFLLIVFLLPDRRSVRVPDENGSAGAGA